MPEVESTPVAPVDPAEPPQQPENALLGKYELGKLLGCGAFAKVYHARESKTGQSVAIKIIKKKKIANPTLMTNIKREISIMRRLRHKNIVKLFEVLATKTKIYFVMEFVKGGELFGKISKGRFSEDLSRKYLQQLISAVGYCHARGVYHRDLKPENLLLDENGDLKVSDFGLSAVKDQVHSDGLLHTLCGTPAYVAPEILTKKGYHGAKVDIWSCGVILYVLAAGYLPFNDPNLMMMYKKIYKGDFKCPKWMSSDLKRLLSRVLETNPEKRITIDGIMRDNWFKKGFQEPKFYEEDFGVKDFDEEPDGQELNAFGIISFSSGLDLSGLFDEASGTGNDCERFVVVAYQQPEKIMQKVTEMINKDEMINVKMKKKKEWAVELEDENGDSILSVKVYKLNENMVVVEGKRKSGGDTFYADLWKKKIRPELASQPSVTPQQQQQQLEVEA